MSRYSRRKGVSKQVEVVADLKDRGDRGDTLIEVLFALFVLGLTGLALIIAFSTSISATQRHRQIATANIVLDSASQQAISQIEQNTALFGCGYSVQAAAFIGGGVNFTIPQNYGGYTAQIYNVEYWNASQNQFVTGCIPGNVPMEVEVEVTDTNDSETYFNTFVVDLPSGDLGIGPDLSNGIPSQLVFGGTPGETATGSSGVAFSPQPVVSVLDSNNEVVESDLSPIVLSIEGNPVGVSISGCSANDPDGVATFSGCTITGTAGTYRVHATVLGQGLDSDPSGTGQNANSINLFGSSFWESTPTWYGTTFTVTVAAAPDKVVFALPNLTPSTPVAAASGSAMSTQPSIDIETGAGVVDTTQNGNVTLAVSGGALTNCAVGGVPVVTSSGGGGPNEILTVPVVAGMVSLTGCDFSGAIFWNQTASPPGPDATKYTLTASYTNSASATAPIFVTAAGSPTKVVFSTQPSGVSSTSPTTPWPLPFAVEVEDAFGNPAYSVNAATVSAAFVSADTNETLSNCTEKSVTDTAIATFTNCKGTNYGGGLKLTATYGGLSATSAAFSISTDAASLKFTTQPQAGPSGSALTTQPVIEILDGSGNVDTGFSGSITLTASGGVLSGCTSLTPNDGVVTVGTCLFAGNAGTPYTMTAGVTNGAGTALSVTSAPFTPSQAGVATQLQFTTQPVAGATAGSLMATQPVVKVEDSQGNVVTNSSATITLKSSGGTLTGCSTLTAVAGVVNVSGCSFGGLIGSYYTLNATSPGLTSATSALFASNTAAGTESGVLITVSPASVGVDNVTNAALTLQIVDAWGNDTVSTGTTSLTVSSSSTGGFFSNTEGNTGPLGVSTTVNIAAGSSSGTVYYGDETAGVPTITAYNNVTVIAFGSTSLTVNPNPPTQLVYSTAPPATTTAGSGTSFSVVVSAEDQFNNVVSTDGTTSVSLAASNGASNGGFTCSSVTEVVIAGVATFQNCYFTSASPSPYTVTASAAGLTSATATTTVTGGAAVAMSIWSGNNQSAPTTTAFTNPLRVLVTDASGNPVSGVTVTFTSLNIAQSGTLLATGGACVASGGAVVNTCTAVTNVNGIASSASLTAGTADGRYHVIATSTGLPTALFIETNTTPTLVALTAAQSFTTQTGSPATTSGSIVIQSQDGNGNPIVQTTSLTVNVSYAKPGVTTTPGTVTILPGSSTATFTLTAATAAAAGNFTVTAAATNYVSATQTETIRTVAVANSATVAPSTPATVAPGGATTSQVLITNKTGGTLSYEVIAVNGLESGETFTAPACSAAVTTGKTKTFAEQVTTSSARASGAYTLDFIVESFSNNNCGGTTAFYQGDATLTIGAGAAATIAISGGNSQIATAGSAFGSALSAVVTDGANNPVAGVVVTFTAPTSGAGGTFLANGSGACVASGGTVVTTCTATTGANGVASSLTFTANAVTGTYAISVTAPGVAGSPLAYNEENQ
jgi:type II secretory pathway pseudopilin PulG